MINQSLLPLVNPWMWVWDEKIPKQNKATQKLLERLRKLYFTDDPLRNY